MRLLERPVPNEHPPKKKQPICAMIVRKNVDTENGRKNTSHVPYYLAGLPPTTACTYPLTRRLCIRVS